METTTAGLNAVTEDAFATLNSVPIPVHSMDGDGLLCAVNKAWVDFTGYRADEALGRSFSDFLEAGSAERYRRAAVPEMVEQVAAGQVRLVEYTLIKASGDRVDIVLAAQPIRDDHGTFLHSFAVITDITARNRAEQALRNAQRLEAIGALTSGIAHDFNNLLTIVQNSLHLLGRFLPAGDERAANLLDAARQGTRRGAALTSRLLAFARQQDLDPRAIAVPHLLETVRPMLQQLLGARIAIRQDVPAALASLHADPHQLELALINLAANARDAMPDGGSLIITARHQWVSGTESAFITPFAEQSAAHDLAPGGYVVLAVTDTGTGMEPAVLARAADPFFTTKGVGKGTGLGLSMVHGFAKQSGGTLHLESRLGHGTTAELWLPSLGEASGAGSVAVSPDVACPSERAGCALRILLVDDDVLVLASTLAFLEHLHPASVHAVTSGKDALSVLRHDGGFDLLLTDYMMPDMSGTELAAAARALHPRLPVLIASGFADADELARSSWPCLRKPYSLDQFVQALDEISGPHG